MDPDPINLKFSDPDLLNSKFSGPDPDLTGSNRSSMVNPVYEMRFHLLEKHRFTKRIATILRIQQVNVSVCLTGKT
jgi:hypothetical protein